MLAASVDVGTNTVRLLIAQAGLEGVRCLERHRRVVRLGEGFAERLAPGARRRALEALERFGQRLRERGVERVFGVATGVMRQARDAERFLQEARARGVPLRVIDGRTEALLTLRGVLWALGGRRHAVLMADVGGATTELVLWRPGGVERWASLPLGVVYLTEGMLRHDPPGQQELEAVRRRVRSVLEEALRGWGCRGAELIGTAGTPTTLAAMDQGLRDYDPRRVNGYRLSREGLRAWLERLRGMPAARRLEIAGLERGREDVILSGICILLELMELADAPQLTVSDGGLLEGALLAGLEEAGVLPPSTPDGGPAR